jgi:hypothetical protein
MNPVLALIRLSQAENAHGLELRGSRFGPPELRSFPQHDQVIGASLHVHRFYCLDAIMTTFDSENCFCRDKKLRD